MADWKSQIRKYIDVPVQKNMARKRRAALCDDGDDDDDELYQPQKSSRKTRVTKEKVADENSEPPATCSHSKSLHTINSASSLREALLVWYSQVHARRRMPWRKPYNPSLDADGHAQRAYEVPFVFVLVCSPPRPTCGSRRFGCLRLCCSRPKFPQSFRTMIGG